MVSLVGYHASYECDAAQFTNNAWQRRAYDRGIEGSQRPSKNFDKERR
jgi:hypothetical protein